MDSGNFFAIDTRSFETACSHGLNAAIAYLVLARGTGRDNETSHWSAKSIEKYTGISRGFARQAVRTLIRTGIARQLRAGGHPIYRLAGHKERTGLTPRQVEVMTLVADGGQPDQRHDHDVTESLIAAEVLITAKDGFAIGPNGYDGTRWTWMPNEVVTGAAGEVPPLELIRQRQDVLTLRLFFSLYGATDLRAHGGIDRTIMWRTWTRHSLAQQGAHMVLGFVDDNEGFVDRGSVIVAPHVDGGSLDAFGKRLGTLLNLGLLEWIPHLIESDSDHAEVVYEISENVAHGSAYRLHRAAMAAARRILTEAQAKYANQLGCRFIVPVQHHMDNVQMIDIARLRYRPKTQATAAWLAHNTEQTRKFIELYRKMAAKPKAGAIHE